MELEDIKLANTQGRIITINNYHFNIFTIALAKYLHDFQFHLTFKYYSCLMLTIGFIPLVV